MPIITVDEARAQLNFTADMGDSDNTLLSEKIRAAEAYMDNALGYRMSDRYGSSDLPAYPDDLVEAAKQLIAHWYENREVLSAGGKSMPYGVYEILQAHRDWTF